MCVQQAHPGDRNAWVRGAWQLVLSRDRSPEEKEKAISFLKAGDSEFAKLCLVLLNMNEFLYID